MIAARRQLQRRGARALLAVILLAGIGPVRGQHVSILDPLDVLWEMRDYMRTHLPAHWWYEDPRPFLDGYQVVVHLAKGWRGNPTSAMMQLCPPSRHKLWTGMKRLNLLPMLDDLPRPGYDCRPPPGIRPPAAGDGLIDGQ